MTEQQAKTLIKRLDRGQHKLRNACKHLTDTTALLIDYTATSTKLSQSNTVTLVTLASIIKDIKEIIDAETSWGSGRVTLTNVIFQINEQNENNNDPASHGK